MHPFTVHLSTLPGDQSDLHEVHSEIWEELVRFLGYYWGTQSTIADLIEGTTFDEGNIADADALTLVFPLAEGDPRAEEGYAWLRIGFAAALSSLDATVNPLGWWIDGPREDVPEVFDRFASALSHESPLHAMIAPGEDFIENMAQSFGNGQAVEHVVTAAWYVGNTARPPIHVVEAMVERCERDPDGVFPAVSRSLERLAERLDLHAIVEDRLSGNNPVGYALATTLLPSLIARDLFEEDQVVEVLLRGLELDEPASDTCAEMLSRVPADDATLERIYAALVARLDDDPPEETLHNVILTLINLYLNIEPVPPGIVAVFERWTAAPSPIDGLAQWAVQVFSSKVQEAE